MSSASVAAIVFSEWKFSQDVVDYIAGSDRPETAPEYAAMGARALKIAKVLAPLGKESMSAESVRKARELAIEYGFSEEAFDKMAESVSNKIEE